VAFHANLLTNGLIEQAQIGSSMIMEEIKKLSMSVLLEFLDSAKNIVSVRKLITFCPFPLDEGCCI